MKGYPSTHIRNVGLVAHQSAGKTSLAEAMIFNFRDNYMIFTFKGKAMIFTFRG